MSSKTERLSIEDIQRQYDAERTKLELELKQWLEKAEASENDVKKESEEASRAEASLQASNVEKTKLERTLADLQAELSTVSTERDGSVADLHQKTEEMERSKSKLSKLKRDIDQMHADSSDSTVQLENTLRDLQKQRESTAANAASEAETLKMKIKEEEDKYNTVSTQLATVNSEIEHTQKQINEEVANSSKAEEEIKVLAEQRVELGSKSKESSKELSRERKETISKADSERKRLLEEVKQTEGVLKVLKVGLKKAKQKVQGLTEQAEKYKSFADRVAVLERIQGAIAPKLADALVSLRTETTLRKQFHSMVEDLKGKVRVYCRVRPLLKSTETGCTEVTRVLDEYSVNVEAANVAGSVAKDYVFDRVFGPKSTQQDVYDECKQLFENAFNGYNVCIFAYGQTSSGKTYTVHGEPSNLGLTPRAINKIYEMKDSAANVYNVTISCYMLELYNDVLYDLLKDPEADSPKLKIKLNAESMVYVQNAAVLTADTTEEMLNILNSAAENRHVAETKMNADSSRSHLIFSMLISLEHKTTDYKSVGKLSLIDLAGSERVGKSGAEGMQLVEARAINKSLAALGNVISALSGEKQTFVPYRSSQLTLLLMDSLGGTAKTLMFVNISPSSSNVDETRNTLDYGQRAKSITNAPAKDAEQKLLQRLSLVLEHLYNLSQDQTLSEEQHAQLAALIADAGFTVAPANINEPATDDMRSEGGSRAASPNPMGQPQIQPQPQLHITRSLVSSNSSPGASISVVDGDGGGGEGVGDGDGEEPSTSVHGHVGRRMLLVPIASNSRSNSRSPGRRMPSTRSNSIQPTVNRK